MQTKARVLGDTEGPREQHQGQKIPRRKALQEAPPGNTRPQRSGPFKSTTKHPRRARSAHQGLLEPDTVPCRDTLPTHYEIQDRIGGCYSTQPVDCVVPY